jgi:hypothetical protein
MQLSKSKAVSDFKSTQLTNVAYETVYPDVHASFNHLYGSYMPQTTMKKFMDNLRSNPTAST